MVDKEKAKMKIKNFITLTLGILIGQLILVAFGVISFNTNHIEKNTETKIVQDEILEHSKDYLLITKIKNGSKNKIEGEITLESSLLKKIEDNERMVIDISDVLVKIGHRFEDMERYVFQYLEKVCGRWISKHDQQIGNMFIFHYEIEYKDIKIHVNDKNEKDMMGISIAKKPGVFCHDYEYIKMISGAKWVFPFDDKNMKNAMVIQFNEFIDIVNMLDEEAVNDIKKAWSKHGK